MTEHELKAIEAAAAQSSTLFRRLAARRESHGMEPTTTEMDHVFAAQERTAADMTVLVAEVRRLQDLAARAASVLDWLLPYWTNPRKVEAESMERVQALRDELSQEKR